MLQWLQFWKRKPAKRRLASRPAHRRQVYDAAGDKDNKRHWQNVDGLSSRAANSPEIRKKLRERGRYEADNSCHGSGLGRSLPVHVVGIGPRLQVKTEIPAWNRQIAEAWRDWAKKTRLAAKLRTMVRSRMFDGESFGLMATNPKLRTPVKLDLKLIETEQIGTPDLYWDEANAVDGIRFDEFGNPIEYHLLKDHPGDLFALSQEYERIPADSVLHWFLGERPGQARGVCEMQPALGTMAQLRRWIVAVLGAAETAALHAGVLETQNDPDDEEAPEPFDTIDLERMMIVTTPAGSKLSQMKPEQPGATFQAFKQEELKDVGRPVQAPYAITAGDSSPYNFSSAKMDFGLFRLARIVERQDCVEVVLDPLFEAWLKEARLIPGLLPAELDIATVPHEWHWPGWIEIDPVKEATADTERLEHNTDTLASVCAERGLDWEEVLEQRAKEMAKWEELRKQYSLPAAVPPAEPQPAPPADELDAEEEDEEQDDEEQDQDKEVKRAA